MPKIKPNYLKCIVIVHGKSEKQICEYIKSNLRFRMEIIGKSNGEHSIQINGLQALLFSDWRFADYENFLRSFPDIELETRGRRKRISSDFKIFLIMDTDDCSEIQKNRYINKELFQNHWAYDYFVPIFDSPDLENVLIKAGIQFQKKGRRERRSI